MKDQRLRILQMVKDNEIALENADQQLLFLSTVVDLDLGVDMDGNKIHPNDRVSVWGDDNGGTVFFGRHREMHECGDVVGYCILDGSRIIKEKSK